MNLRHGLLWKSYVWSIILHLLFLENTVWIPAVIFECFYTLKKIPGVDQWLISPIMKNFPIKTETTLPAQSLRSEGGRVQRLFHEMLWFYFVRHLSGQDSYPLLREISFLPHQARDMLLLKEFPPTVKKRAREGLTLPPLRGATVSAHC